MAEPPEDFDLQGCLDRVRSQDQRAARELVEHLYPQVIRIVRGHLPRRVLEEDLAQDIFLKVFHRLDQYQAKVPFTHWVSRIAVTTCIDALRAQQRRPELRMADLSEGEADALHRSMQGTLGEAPGEALAANELISKLLAQLKPEDRLVLQFIDIEQRSVAETAALTGWNKALVKVRAFRARRKLASLFKELNAREHT